MRSPSQHQARLNSTLHSSSPHEATLDYALCSASHHYLSLEVGTVQCIDPIDSPSRLKFTTVQSCPKRV